jgi:hypothetical protein
MSVNKILYEKIRQRLKKQGDTNLNGILIEVLCLKEEEVDELTVPRLKYRNNKKKWSAQDKIYLMANSHMPMHHLVDHFGRKPVAIISERKRLRKLTVKQREKLVNTVDNSFA